MKTRTHVVRITPQGSTRTDEEYFLHIRTTGGDLMLNRLLSALKSDDEVEVPRSLVTELLTAYIKKSKKLKALKKENSALKKALSEKHPSSSKKKVSWPPGEAEPFG